MKCRDCRFLAINVPNRQLYVCGNADSEHFGEYLGRCYEYEFEDCKDGEKYEFFPKLGEKKTEVFNEV